MSSAPGPTRPIDTMVTVDDQGYFLNVSPGFLELIGMPVERLAGSNLVDHVHPDDAATARQLLAAATKRVDSVAIMVEVFDAADEWSPVELSFEHAVDDRLDFRLRTVSAGGPTSVVEGVPTPTVPVSPATAAPVLSGAVDDDFPYDDSPEHLAYVASIPDHDIVDRRAAARRAAGPADAPMIEIDGHGHTIYVSGPWAELGDDGATGVEVFEQLIERSGTAEAVMRSVDDACRRSRADRHPLQVGGLPPRWIQVTPIPSPHVATETHALVSILTESLLRDSGE